jgi:hypothetical protein
MIEQYMMKVSFLKDIKDVNNRTYEGCVITQYQYYYTVDSKKDDKFYIDISLQDYAKNYHIEFDRIEIIHIPIGKPLSFNKRKRIENDHKMV